MGTSLTGGYDAPILARPRAVRRPVFLPPEPRRRTQEQWPQGDAAAHQDSRDLPAGSSSATWRPRTSTNILLADDADIGLATVYRVLMQFEQAGLLVRNHFESGKAVFELNEGRHHDHLVCLGLRARGGVLRPEIEKRQRAVAASAVSLSCRTTRCRCTPPQAQEELPAK